ncbi:MAG: hypothetical protein GY861_10685 [bacterium]|nr:hypothetical protein [bacterium]
MPSLADDCVELTLNAIKTDKECAKLLLYKILKEHPSLLEEMLEEDKK